MSGSATATGPRPSDCWAPAGRGWLAIKPRTPWTVGGETTKPTRSSACLFPLFSPASGASRDCSGQPIGEPSRDSGIGLSVGVSLFMPRSASRDARHADTLPGVAHGGRTVRGQQGARPARAVAAAVLAGFAAASVQRQVAGLARPTPSRAMLAVSPPAAAARPTDYGTWSR